MGSAGTWGSTGSRPRSRRAAAPSRRAGWARTQRRRRGSRSGSTISRRTPHGSAPRSSPAITIPPSRRGASQHRGDDLPDALDLRRPLLGRPRQTAPIPVSRPGEHEPGWKRRPRGEPRRVACRSPSTPGPSESSCRWRASETSRPCQASYSPSSRRASTPTQWMRYSRR